MAESTGTAAANHAQRGALLGVALVVGLLLAVAGTFLLWQISDRVGELESGGGAPAEEGEAPRLPPPAEGSARSLANEFDRTTGRLTSTLQGVRETLERAQLHQVAPALGQLQQNTAAFPDTLASLDQLVEQTRSLPGLGEGVTDLGGELRVLRGELPGLTLQLGSTGRQLGLATGTLEDLRGAVSATNLGLDRIRLVLEATVRSLDETRKSIDRTNECLARPVVCETTPAQRGSAPQQPR